LPIAAQRHQPSLWVIFVTILLDLLGFGMVMPFLAVQARDAFGVDAATAALLGTCYSAFQFLFMPIWGGLSDRIGRRPVMLFSILGSALSMTACGLCLAYAQSIGWLFLVRSLAGAAAANIGTASAYIADITSPEDRIKGMSMIGIAFGVGFIVGPGFGGLLSSFVFNGREGPLVFFAAGALSFVNLIWALFSLPESLPPERRAVAHGSAGARRMTALRLVLGRPGSAHAAISNGLMILAFSGLEITYALYAKDLFQLTQRQVGLLFVYMAVLGGLVQGGFVRRAAGRYRESSLAYVGLSMMLCGFAGFLVVPQLGLWSLFVASAAVGVGHGFIQPAFSAYISRLTDASRQGEALSGSQSLSSLARVFGPLLAGQLYTFSPLWPFAGCALINVVALVVALGMRNIQPPTRDLSPGIAAAQ
jgi:DHA1 family tetracycline resistance protein-like MFS transporter